MVASVTGIPPVVGHVKVSGDGEAEQQDWHSSTDFTTASCSVIDRIAVATKLMIEKGGHYMDRWTHSQ